MTMDTIESKHIGTVDGFDIDARIVFDPDPDTSPHDYDCYDAEVIEAWNRDEWHYVGTIVTASKAGVVLGEASLWGSEYGMFPGVDGWISPLDGEGDSFINGYGPQLINEAIGEARAAVKINRGEA